MMQKRNPQLFLLAVTTVTVGLGFASAQKTNRPWMDFRLSPEERSELVLKELTLDEKLALVHGNGMAGESQWQMPLTGHTNGGAGYTEGVERLGIPPLIIPDAGYGVRASGANELLHTFDESEDSWKLAGGDYGVLVGSSSENTPLRASLLIN
jgi:beta-glucosidase